jgi:acyl carrier protein
MNDAQRLAGCFQTVFPDLPEKQIRAATQANVAAWDSIAGITLVNVIEEEFHIPLDFELLGELDSFERILKYLEQHKSS